MDIPRIFNITANAHRIHNPFTCEKLATLGAALRLEPGTRVLDLGSGSGEMLCTWARDYGIIGTGTPRTRVHTWAGGVRADGGVRKRLPNDSESGETPIMPNKPSHHTVESRADAAFYGW